MDAPDIDGFSDGGKEEPEVKRCKEAKSRYPCVAEKEHYCAMKKFFSEGHYSEAWKKFEDALTKKKSKSSTPKKVKVGSQEALALYRKNILRRQLRAQRSSKKQGSGLYVEQYCLLLQKNKRQGVRHQGMKKLREMRHPRM